MNDSLGNPDPTRYNLAVWNGNDWSIRRVPYFYQGQPFYNPIQSIFAFGTNDIWFCGNGVIHWNGNNFVPMPVPTTVWGPYQMNKIWGTSSNDLYIVGNGGNIAHYGGPSVGWKKIEGGTTLNINDIWGDFNEKTQEWEILAVAANVNSSVERALIKISNNTSQIISSSPIQWSLRTIWFKVYKQYYIAGSGIYAKHSLVEELWANSPLDITSFYTNRIRGNDINDLIGVGAFGDLVHFNGWQWKTDYTQPNLNFGSYLSVDFKNDIVVAVGLEYNQAAILIGIR